MERIEPVERLRVSPASAPRRVRETPRRDDEGEPSRRERQPDSEQDEGEAEDDDRPHVDVLA